MEAVVVHSYMRPVLGPCKGTCSLSSDVRFQSGHFQLCHNTDTVGNLQRYGTQDCIWDSGRIDTGTLRYWNNSLPILGIELKGGAGVSIDH